jgi:hypothetical protein
MPKYEIQHPDGRKFEVEAPSIEAAEAEIKGIPHGAPISQFAAAMEGVKSGVTAGFSDEIKGLKAASGASDSFFDPRAIAPGLVGAARLGYEKLTGQEGEATAAYRKARDAERDEQKNAEEQYPKTHFAGEVGGSFVLPAGAAARTAALPVRMLRAAKTGAAIGALSGAGHGEGAEDSAVRAGVGTIAGAGLGAAGVPIAQAVGSLVAPIASKIAGPIANTARGLFNPRDEAGRQVVTAIERDIRADPNAASRLNPSEFSRAAQEGQPVAAVDIGGDLTRRLADVAAMTSPEAETTLKGAINSRFESQSPRLAAWLREKFHYPDAAAQQEAIDTAARAANKPAYARANADAAKLHPGGLWDEGFEQLAQDPVVQAAIRKANVTSRSAAARQGVSEGQAITPIRSPFTMDANGRMMLRVEQDGSRARPTLQFWDEVKKSLDKTGSFEARSMARVLRDHIDGLVPSYQAARAGAAHFFGAENALEAGQNFVGASARYGLPAARKALSQMSQEERQLFQDGYVSRLVEKIEATGDRRSVVNQISQSGAAREEIRMALGPQRADEVEARLRVEGVMDLVRNAVQGNSWTARRLYDLGLAGGAGLSLTGTYQTDPKEMAIGGIIAALSSGGKKINSNVMRHVAELLVSNDLRELSKGVQIVARNSRLLDALRSTDRRIASISGEQTANLPAIQAGGVGAAQGNQNQVPRPPGQ